MLQLCKLFVLDHPTVVTPEVESGFDGVLDRDEDSEQLSPLPLQRHTSSKGPAWTNSDDAAVQISLASNKRLRKLRDTASEDSVGGRDYKRRLRRQSEKLNPAPEWASSAKKQTSEILFCFGPDEEHLFASTGGKSVDKHKDKSKTFSSRTISNRA